MGAEQINFLAGWVGMLGGVISGSLIGLYFHRAEWLGGYGSFRRRLVRLGHISFFGLGFINFLFALSASRVSVQAPYLEIASVGLLVGAVTMPLCCFLTAWREPLRHLFPIPVIGVLSGILSFLLGWHAG